MNKKLLIIGLGLIGGSYALKLQEKGYEIYGIDKNQEVLDYAIKNKIIKEGRLTPEVDFINQFDYVILALYPKTLLEFVNKYHNYFKKDCIISDVSGIKEYFIYKVQELLPQCEFIGAHPMAGRETLGIYNAKKDLFIKANYIITPTDKNTTRGIEFAKQIGQDLDVYKISMLSPQEHDMMIAYLSQLTHTIAISLMTCKDTTNLASYSGDSFTDLTRIAKIDENMWSELFILNKDKLVEEMEIFIQDFIKLKECIAQGDETKIKELMRLSSLRREYFIKK